MRLFDLFENAEDDELFGTKSTVLSGKEISNGLRRYSNKIRATAERFLGRGMAQSQFLRDADKVDELANIFNTEDMSHGVREFAALNKEWNGDLYTIMRDDYRIDLASQLNNLRENADPSDEELFGKTPTNIQTLIKAMRGYHDGTMDELHLYRDEEVRKELEDEADQADYIATLLKQGSIAKGLSALADLDRQTRGTMTEILKSYYIDLPEILKANNLNEDEPSDDDLFGASKYNIAEIVKLLVAIGEHYHRTSDAELVLDDADVVLDAADNFQQRGMTAGANRLLDVNQPSVMGYLTAMFHEKLGIDINKMFKEYATDMYESAEPSDDDLFGDDIDPQMKLIKLIDDQIQFNKSQLRIISINSRAGNDTDLALVDQRQKNIKRLEDYKRAFSHSLHDGLALWSGDIAETDAFKNPYRNLALMLRNEARHNGIDLSERGLGNIYEESDPSDSDLFGDEDIQLQTRAIKVIAKLIANIESVIQQELAEVGVTSVEELDPWGDEEHEDVYDEIQADLRAKKYYQFFAQEFKKSDVHGLVAWHNEMIKQDDGYNAAEMLDEIFTETYGMDLDSYFNELNEAAEPSDDDLFGEKKYDNHKIGDVVASLGNYYIENKDDEGMGDEIEDANTLVVAGEKFRTQGMLAGIQALEFMESLAAWDQLETDLAHELGIDLNEMIDSYTSAG